jgi:hypothetical protein
MLTGTYVAGPGGGGSSMTFPPITSVAYSLGGAGGNVASEGGDGFVTLVCSQVISASPSPSPTPSFTPTNTPSPTTTLSLGATPSVSPTGTGTPSKTSTPSNTPSNTPSISATASPNGCLVSFFAGSGACCSSTDGAASTSTFNIPYSLVVTANNSIVYVADRNGHKIRRIVGGVVSSFGTGTATWVDGPSPSFRNPSGIALTEPSQQSLVIADYLNNRIRLLNLVTGFATTIAGTGSATWSDNVIGTLAAFYYPEGVATSIFANNTVYISDT